VWQGALRFDADLAGVVAVRPKADKYETCSDQRTDRGERTLDVVLDTGANAS